MDKEDELLRLNAEKEQMLKDGVGLADLVLEVRMTNVYIQDMAGYLVGILERLRTIEHNQPNPRDR